jgi:hypothetical protein
VTYKSYRTFVARLGVITLAAGIACVSVGCKKSDDKATAEKAEGKKKPRGDRFADGQRLAGAQKEWAKRWAETLDLPACDSLLKAPADQEVCKTAQAALVTLKAAVAKPEPESVLIHAAAELAFASEAASEKLRTAFMEKSQAETKAAPGASGAAPSAKPAPSSAKPAPSGAKAPLPNASAFSAVRTRAISSAGKAAFMDKIAGREKEGEAAPIDPDQQLLQAYARAGRAALRYLGQFLQYGPLPTRNATFVEVEALSHRKETWPALARTLREAAMTEKDQSLQAKLKALVPKLARRTPTVAPEGAPAAAPEAAPAAAPEPSEK